MILLVKKKQQPGKMSLQPASLTLTEPALQGRGNWESSSCCRILPQPPVPLPGGSALSKAYHPRIHLSCKPPQEGDAVLPFKTKRPVVLPILFSKSPQNQCPPHQPICICHVSDPHNFSLNLQLCPSNPSLPLLHPSPWSSGMTQVAFQFATLQRHPIAYRLKSKPLRWHP